MDPMDIVDAIMQIRYQAKFGDDDSNPAFIGFLEGQLKVVDDQNIRENKSGREEPYREPEARLFHNTGWSFHRQSF
jgi:hypothetical protein